MKKLILILGDQLHHNIAALRSCDKASDRIYMCEVMAEATYVKHHKQKLVFIFSAMRHFAQALTDQGYCVEYTQLNDKHNSHSFATELTRITKQYGITHVVVTKPGEYRVLKNLKDWEATSNISLDIKDDDRFLCNDAWFNTWASGRKQLRMEFFYREMRKKYQILMNEDGTPMGGTWNFDKENRENAKDISEFPRCYQQSPDDITTQVISMVSTQFADHFGDIEHFHYAVTRKQALAALHQFIEERLAQFGTYQDAMIEGQPFMYHSALALYLNAGLLTPMECIEKAEQAYYDQKAPINAVEGFIRQILGWREFVRAIYWRYMPEYQSLNALNATRALPEFYWTANTKMNCIKQCVNDTKKHAYAHHIQRLMVLGNFALLAGIHPNHVNEWYLLVYADAYEWVELPNVTGMVLFADDGIVASKPYAAGGAYIHRMSDYCKGCQYKVSKKEGKEACPFNYLYWNFLITHKEKFAKNHRMTMIYKTLRRMKESKIQQIREDAEWFLSDLNAR